jgi:hypothetical protein
LQTGFRQPPFGTPVMVGPGGRLSAHERMFCATAARGGLSMASVMRPSPAFGRHVETVDE